MSDAKQTCENQNIKITDDIFFNYNTFTSTNTSIWTHFRS